MTLTKQKILKIKKQLTLGRVIAFLVIAIGLGYFKTLYLD